MPPDWLAGSVHQFMLASYWGGHVCAAPSCNYESYVGNLSTVTVLNSKWLFVVGLASLKQENLQLLAVMFRFVKHFITQETVWWPFQCSNLCLGKAQVTTASSHHNIYDLWSGHPSAAPHHCLPHSHLGCALPLTWSNPGRHGFLWVSGFDFFYISIYIFWMLGFPIMLL